MTLSIILAGAIGFILLLSAALKAFYAVPFIGHVRQLGFLSEKPSALLAVTFIEIEAGLGTALMLNLYTFELIPFTIGLIVSLTLLTYWGITKGKIKDCGCYGGLVDVSPKQTYILNTGYPILLCLAWIFKERDILDTPWKSVAVIATILLFHLTLKRSSKKPLFSIISFKEQSSWNKRWIPLQEYQSPQLIFLLDTRCEHCNDWIKRLNTLSPNSTINLLGLIPEDSVDKVKDNITFPVQFVRKPVFQFLLGEIPMAVYLNSEIIRKVWRKQFPEDVFFKTVQERR